MAGRTSKTADEEVPPATDHCFSTICFTFATCCSLPFFSSSFPRRNAVAARKRNEEEPRTSPADPANEGEDSAGCPLRSAASCGGSAAARPLPTGEVRSVSMECRTAGASHPSLALVAVFGPATMNASSAPIVAVRLHLLWVARWTQPSTRNYISQKEKGHKPV